MFQSTEDFEQWNDEMSNKYDPDDYLSSTNPIIRFFEVGRLKKILQLLATTDSSKILDVGCGTGHLLLQVKGQKFGIDISTRYLERAKSRLPDAMIVRCNAEKISELNFGTFTHAVCSEVLEHTEHPLEVLKGMKSALGPGGKAVISVPNDILINRLKKILNSFNLYRLLFPTIHKSLENEWHIHIFSREMITGLCREAGFTTVKLHAVPWFLPVHFIVEME